MYLQVFETSEWATPHNPPERSPLSKWQGRKWLPQPTIEECKQISMLHWSRLLGQGDLDCLERWKNARVPLPELVVSHKALPCDFLTDRQEIYPNLLIVTHVEKWVESTFRHYIFLRMEKAVRKITTLPFLPSWRGRLVQEKIAMSMWVKFRSG